MLFKATLIYVDLRFTASHNKKHGEPESKLSGARVNLNYFGALAELRIALDYIEMILEAP